MRLRLPALDSGPEISSSHIPRVGGSRTAPVAVLRLLAACICDPEMLRLGAVSSDSRRCPACCWQAMRCT